MMMYLWRFSALFIKVMTLESSIFKVRAMYQQRKMKQKVSYSWITVMLHVQRSNFLDVNMGTSGSTILSATNMEVDNGVCYFWLKGLLNFNRLWCADNPDVVLLQVSGTVDTDLVKLTANEMMMWDLANLWKDGCEGGYSIRHGHLLVHDFGRPLEETNDYSETTIDLNKPNFFEKVYPTLFPYGHGGIEADRASPVKFCDYIIWALQYFDHCFQKHEMFPFVAFGISQQKVALRSAQVQMQWKKFEQDAQVMAWITLHSRRRKRMRGSQYQILVWDCWRAMLMLQWGKSLVQISLEFNCKVQFGQQPFT